MKALLTAIEVSKILRCDVHKVYELEKKGLLKGIHMGRLKFREETIEEFLKQMEGKA